MNEQGMRLIKSITGKRVALSAEAFKRAFRSTDTAAALSEESPLLDVALWANGCDGYVMQYTAGAVLSASSWHANPVEAENHANALFGLRHSDWQTPEKPDENTNPRQPLAHPESGSRSSRHF